MLVPDNDVLHPHSVARNASPPPAGARSLDDSFVGRTFHPRGSGRPKLDAEWTPDEGVMTTCVCKSLTSLVGPPRFELGTSCTPSKRASQAAPRPETPFYPSRSSAARISSSA